MGKFKYFGWLSAALLLLILVFNSYTTVEAGHNKVATLFGKVQPEPYSEGLHIVNPLLNFISFDLRQQTYTWEKVHVPSQDKLKTSMDISVTFRLDGSRTPTILQESGTLEDVVSKHITPKVRSLLREAGKTVEQSQDFYLDSVQQQLQSYMENGLREYLDTKGVIVTAVLFRDITLPQVVTDAVIQTKERQEQLEREKAQLKIVEQQAQQQVKQAEARQMAAVADANAKKIQADAEAYRISKEAEAQAKANELLAKSVTPALIRYNAVHKWNGEYPRTLLGGKNEGLILSLPTTGK
ncbi:SPFH domain-containing protein [Methylomarinum vadi]|uniref:SPFH domain-containing protein n=1 Tax=Methylomarinum vadi TaxID=438855 RepID=UPI0006905101|nr:SPFH domain-containing protein [Methylomarinum vadi]